MRVNRTRLDLKSLIIDTPCTITTGVSSVKLVHGRQTIDMGLYLKGTPPMRISDPVNSTEDEHGTGVLTQWLHLDALAPRRLYVIKVTRVEKNGQVTGWQLKDATPGADGSSKSDRAKPWGIIGKLLGKGGRDD